MRTLRFVFVAATAALLLAVGALSAAAGNRHHAGAPAGAIAIKGQTLTALTTGAMIEVKALDDEAQAEAARLEAAKAEAALAAAAKAAIQAQPSQGEDSDSDDQQNNADEGDSGD